MLLEGKTGSTEVSSGPLPLIITTCRDSIRSSRHLQGMPALTTRVASYHAPPEQGSGFRCLPLAKTIFESMSYSHLHRLDPMGASRSNVLLHSVRARATGAECLHRAFAFNRTYREDILDLYLFHSRFARRRSRQLTEDSRRCWF